MKPAEAQKGINEFLLRRRVLTLYRLACDVSSKEAIQELAQTISQKEAKLDILISNAGIRRDPPVQCNVLTASLEELQESMWSSRQSDWTATFQVNTTAHYFLSLAFLPLLAAAANASLGNRLKGQDEGRGAIIITSSCASMHNATNVDLTSYATSKAATDHLVKLLAAKYNRFYVRVLGINPGCKHRAKCRSLFSICADWILSSRTEQHEPCRRGGKHFQLAVRQSACEESSQSRRYCRCRSVSFQQGRGEYRIAEVLD